MYRLSLAVLITIVSIVSLAGQYQEKNSNETILISKNDQNLYFYHYCSSEPSECEPLGRPSGYTELEISKLSETLFKQAEAIFLVNKVADVLFFAASFTVVGRVVRVAKIKSAGVLRGSVAPSILNPGVQSKRWVLRASKMAEVGLSVVGALVVVNALEGYANDKRAGQSFLSRLINEFSLTFDPSYYDRMGRVFLPKAGEFNYPIVGVKGVSIKRLAQGLRQNLWRVDQCTTPLNSNCRRLKSINKH